jgi:hypothetical protein
MNNKLEKFIEIGVFVLTMRTNFFSKNTNLHVPLKLRISEQYMLDEKYPPQPHLQYWSLLGCSKPIRNL